MPTYEYKCPKCKKTVDAMRKIEDRDSPINCPRCETQLERFQSGLAGLIFRGSGFYKTDYSPNKDK